MEETISLIIPAYNEEKYIGACLESALKSAGGKFHEIIVVDNASTDKTREVAERYPGVRVVYEPEKGTNRARQRGFADATGDFLAYIDADTKMPDGWLEKAKTFFLEHPKAVGLSGPYRYYDGSVLERMVMSVLWLFTPLACRIAGYAILGGNFVARRSALVAMGGFDESLEFYGDDTDIAKRLHRQGKVVFSMHFYNVASIRRFVAEGFFRTNFKYAINFIWEAVFGRPFTKKHLDIRT